MADYFKKIRGIIGTILQIGKAGPQIKNVSDTHLQIRNDDDSAFARLQAAAPEADDDVVTRKFLDTIKGTVIVKRQADCSVSLPNNTATRGYVVVTTAGSGTAIGDLLYDNGSASGTMEIIQAVEGRAIFTTESFSGGTISFDPDSLYTWDEDGTKWEKIGDISSLTGPVRIVRYAIDNTASQDSTFTLPANVRVLRADLEIVTPYSGGATISLGTTASAALFQATSDNNPQGAAGRVYSVDQDTDSGAASVVRATIAGAPGAGAGIVTIWFTNPNV